MIGKDNIYFSVKNNLTFYQKKNKNNQRLYNLPPKKDILKDDKSGIIAQST